MRWLKCGRSRLFLHPRLEARSRHWWWGQGRSARWGTQPHLLRLRPWPASQSGARQRAYRRGARGAGGNLRRVAARATTGRHCSNGWSRRAAPGHPTGLSDLRRTCTRLHMHHRRRLDQVCRWRDIDIHASLFDRAHDNQQLACMDRNGNLRKRRHHRRPSTNGVRLSVRLSARHSRRRQAQPPRKPKKKLEAVVIPENSNHRHITIAPPSQHH